MHPAKVYQIVESAFPALQTHLAIKDTHFCIAPNSHGTTPAYVYYLTRNKLRTLRCLDNGTLSRSIF